MINTALSALSFYDKDMLNLVYRSALIIYTLMLYNLYQSCNKIGFSLSNITVCSPHLKGLAQLFSKGCAKFDVPGL